MTSGRGGRCAPGGAVVRDGLPDVPESPFIGRTTECALVRSAVQCLHAMTGVGKDALLRRFALDAAGAGRTVHAAGRSRFAAPRGLSAAPAVPVRGHSRRPRRPSAAGSGVDRRSRVCPPCPYAPDSHAWRTTSRTVSSTPSADHCRCRPVKTSRRATRSPCVPPGRTHWPVRSRPPGPQRVPPPLRPPRSCSVASSARRRRPCTAGRRQSPPQGLSRGTPAGRSGQARATSASQ